MLKSLMMHHYSKIFPHDATKSQHHQIKFHQSQFFLVQRVSHQDLDKAWRLPQEEHPEDSKERCVARRQGENGHQRQKFWANRSWRNFSKLKQKLFSS